MMDNKLVAECLICEKEMFSEITEQHCRLCGMAMTDDSLFCCDNCENKFNSILTGDLK